MSPSSKPCHGGDERMAGTAQQNILVIGAGIVGVSTAIWLQRDGHKVTLIDKIGPAAGASFGNAGVLATGSIIPVTVPGLIGKAPRMLFDPNQPLFLRWSYLPRLVPFLLRYLKNANARKVETTSTSLNYLLHDAPDQHLALAKGTPADAFFSFGDYLFGYDKKATFEAEHDAWAIRTRLGVDYTPLDADALAQFDPGLKGRFGFAVRCANHGAISDPGAYVTALADHFKDQGGVIASHEITGFEISDGQCTGVRTADGTLTADKYVLTTGAWSGQWQKALGITVPLESERGYHIEFVNPSITLHSPIMVVGGKFVVNSMNGRMRCAGVIEFGGLDAPASRAPFRLLKKQMAALFPDLTYDRIDEWMGHRPATADSLPVIGASPKAANVFVGYGHHHIGLTGGPKTGRWLAKLVTNAPINDDLSAFAPDRTA